MEEISGVAFIFNQKFFLNLKEETGGTDRRFKCLIMTVVNNYAQQRGSDVNCSALLVCNLVLCQIKMFFILSFYNINFFIHFYELKLVHLTHYVLCLLVFFFFHGQISCWNKMLEDF